MHYGESEEKDDKTDKLVKHILENDNPSLVVVTGDIVSGSKLMDPFWLIWLISFRQSIMFYYKGCICRV